MKQRGRKESLKKPADKKTLVTLLLQHQASPRGLAKYLKVSHVTIHKWINEFGVKQKTIYY